MSLAITLRAIAQAITGKNAKAAINEAADLIEKIDHVGDLAVELIDEPLHASGVLATRCDDPNCHIAHLGLTDDVCQGIETASLCHIRADA